MSLQSLKVDKCSSNNKNQKHKETAETYFQNLSEILRKYTTYFLPQVKFTNIDESDFSPEHTPPKMAIDNPFPPFEFSKVKECLMS